LASGILSVEWARCHPHPDVISFPKRAWLARCARYHTVGKGGPTTVRCSVNHAVWQRIRITGCSYVVLRPLTSSRVECRWTAYEEMATVRPPPPLLPEFATGDPAHQGVVVLANWSMGPTASVALS